MNNITKILAFSIVILFLLTGISSVYAEQKIVKNINKIKENKKSSLISIKNNYQNDIKDRYLTLEDKLQKKPTFINNKTWDIIVPDNYSTIQQAVDNASIENGYHIFVRSGTYYENILIETDGIVLHGESKENTIINGNNNGNVITIKCNYLNISGFTTNNGNSGFYIFQSSGNIIQDNIIKDNNVGINVFNHSHANNITKNEILDNTRNGISINRFCTGNTIIDNTISNNINFGIAISNVCRANIVNLNEISDNQIGINITNISDGNYFYSNSLISNYLNAFDNSNNSWDNGQKGNYWDDYLGADQDGDGIGDTPYLITGGDNKDRFPLMKKSTFLESCYSKKLREKNVIKDDCPSFNSNLSLGDLIFVPDDYPTIQAAIDHSKDGDTIQVRPGLYREHVIVGKKITIIGEDRESTIVDGEGRNHHVFKLNSDHINLTGFTIKNCTVGFSGVRIYGSFCKIYDNIISNCGGGIEVWTALNTVIEGNYIFDSIWGLYVHFSTDLTFSNNRIENCLYGVEMGFSKQAIITGSILRNCRLKGLLCLGVKDISVEKNIINFNRVGMQFFSSMKALVLDNDLSLNDDGISIFKSEDNLFKDNKINDYESSGISLWFFSENNSIEGNNLIYNKTKYSDSLKTITFIIIYNILLNYLLDFLQINSIILETIIIIIVTFIISVILTLSGQDPDNNNGLQITQSDDNLVENNIFGYQTSIGVNIYSSCVTIIRSNKIVFQENKINNLLGFYSMRGLYLAYSSDNIIKNNEISNITGLLYSLLETSGILCMFSLGNNTIVGNTVNNISTYSLGYNSQTSGISVMGRHNIVNDNKVQQVENRGTAFIPLPLPFSQTIGIHLWDGGSTVSNNQVSLIYGLGFYNSGILIRGSNNLVFNNTVSHVQGRDIFDIKGFGIYLLNNNFIYNNLITNIKGSGLSFTSRNEVFGNTLNECHYGIFPSNSTNSIIYKNNFIDNLFLGLNNNAYDSGLNQWDNGIKGNYWDDYKGIDSNGDGIGDTPYVIYGGDNVDRYPLIEPWVG